MWYPATVTVAVASEPVTLAEAKKHLNVYHDDDDDYIELLISATRQHAENYCGALFAGRTVAVRCDGFCDMGRLSIAPVTSVTSIGYIDTDGAEQTLATSVYALRDDGLETSIALKFGQSWPAIQHASRITLTAVAGYIAAPADVRHALLLRIGEAYEQREDAPVGGWLAFDSLLCNYRRG